MKVSDYAPAFRKAVADLILCGFLYDCRELAPGVVSCETSAHGYGAAARELCERLPGIIIPQKAGGLVWMMGRRVAGRLVDSAAVSTILQAQDTAADIVPDARETWSVGGLARRCLLFVGPAQPYELNAERLIDGVPYGYHECKPGKYVSPEPVWIRGPHAKHLFDEPVPEVRNPAFVPPVVMYDIKSYYYQLFCRMETLRFSVYPNRVRRQRMTPGENARLRDMLACVENNKPLRNSIAGACAGSIKRSRAYTWDKENSRVKVFSMPPMPGPFRAAGLLLVRSGVELCWLEALTNDAVYGTVDSVALTGGRVPTVWRAHGLHYERNASGNAEFCHRGSYVCGPKYTKPYKDGHRDYTPVGRMSEPSVLYFKSWL